MDTTVRCPSVVVAIPHDSPQGAEEKLRRILCEELNEVPVWMGLDHSFPMEEIQISRDRFPQTIVRAPMLSQRQSEWMKELERSVIAAFIKAHVPLKDIKIHVIQCPDRGSHDDGPYE